MRSSIAFLLSFLFVHQASAAKSCVAESLAKNIDVSQTRPANYKHIWKQNEPATTTINGKDHSLTFSFDTEISYGDTLIFIRENPERLKELEQIISRLKISENQNTGLLKRAKNFFKRTKEPEEKIDLLKIPISKIMDADKDVMGMKRSPKQFMSFGGIQKGVPKDQEFYSVLDLNPKLYDYFISDVVEPLIEAKHKGNNLKYFSVTHSESNKFAQAYRDLMQKVLVDDMKLPVKSTLDSGYIELPHESFETSPAEWNRVLKDELNSKLPWSSGHMHIGVPATIGTEKMNAISRAVEARIILEHAVSSSAVNKKLYATSYSTLRGKPHNAGKSAGVIRMNYSRHKSPIEMHDLEVRNYLKFTEGQNHIALATRLAQDHNQLRFIDNFTAAKIDDPNTSNLNGALKYIGIIAKQRGEAEVGEQLIDMATRIEEAGEITIEMRKEVQIYLKKVKILDLLTPDFFLK